MNTNPPKNTGCCAKFEELIQKRLDGEINPEENAALNEHIASCDHCRDELISFSMVQTLLQETIENPVDVPDGLFEKLAGQLEEKAPARGLAWLFSLPIFSFPVFTTYKNISLATASFILVLILSLGVVEGFTHHNSGNLNNQPNMASSHALIQSNRGDSIVMPGDEGDPDRYAAALDDLEKAYREALGQDDGSETQGYIHTSWGDKESASPIH
jgi:hypothetical protein